MSDELTVEVIDVLGRDVERVEPTGTRGLAVFVHGYTGRPRAWRPVARALLPEGFASAALTVLGHGPSASAPATFDAEVDHLAATIDALVATRASQDVVLAGYSLGARLALRLAVRHPSKVTRLVLASGSPGLEGEDARAARRLADATWIELLRTEGLARFAEVWAAQPVLTPRRALDRERLADHHAMRLEHDAEGLARAMEVLGLGAMPDTWPDLATLAVPATLAVGEHDAKFRAINTRMASALPAARLVVIAGAGHDLVLEAPEALAHLVADPTAPG